jgi:hypothetical protein
MEEYTEKLIFFKEGSFDDTSFYIFKNEAGEFRITEAAKYPFSNLQPGTILQARMRKKGCAGREIIALIINNSKESN